MKTILLLIIIFISKLAFSSDKFDTYLNIKTNYYIFGRYTSIYYNDFKNPKSKINLGFDILETYNFNKLFAIQSGLEFNRSSISLIIPTYIYNTYYGPISHNLTFNEIQFPLYFKYNFISHENSRIYAKTGLSYRKILNSKGTLYSSPKINSNDIYLQISNNHYCASINFGFENKLYQNINLVTELKYKLVKSRLVYNGNNSAMYNRIWSVDELININSIIEFSIGINF
jgi:hypothetical protein